MKDVCNLEWFGRVLVESHTVCLEMQDQTAETTSVDIFFVVPGRLPKRKLD